MTTESIPIGKEHHLDTLFAERAPLGKMSHEKFAKDITVMFTDFKGSTAIADTRDDLASRALLKHHNDIVLPIITKNNGILVKTMGDGTMSHFTGAQDTVRAAAQIQSAIDQFNLEKILPDPILVRIGMHTGKGIVEPNDISGEVVNVASGFESIANHGEIYLSEDTYQGLIDKSEIHCRFIKSTTLTGKKESLNVYKAFWNPTEMEVDIAGIKNAPEKPPKKGTHPALKAVSIITPAIIVILVFLKVTNLLTSKPTDENRTKQHSVTAPQVEQLAAMMP